MNSDELYRMFLGQSPTKRSVFVSYHHGGDRAYYDAFSHLFADNYEVVQDNSVERRLTATMRNTSSGGFVDLEKAVGTTDFTDEEDVSWERVLARRASAEESQSLR